MKSENRKDEKMKRNEGKEMRGRTVGINKVNDHFQREVPEMEEVS